MLSRAGENLFWLGRYMERAEATARMISMGQRMAMLPGSTAQSEWTSVMQATAVSLPVDQEVTETDIVGNLILDTDNPSSIQACLGMARENGRAVRTGLTQEMWESLNEDWRYLEGMDPQAARRQLSRILEWVWTRAAVFRGAVETAMLRTEGYDFLRLGGSIERADMTLRLLSVKYFLLLPETEVVGGGRDHHISANTRRGTSPISCCSIRHFHAPLPSATVRSTAVCGASKRTTAGRMSASEPRAPSASGWSASTSTRFSTTACTSSLTTRSSRPRGSARKCPMPTISDGAR